MLIDKYKNFIIAFLLLAFAGQLLASVSTPCLHNMSTISNHKTIMQMHTAMMEHAAIVNDSHCVNGSDDLTVVDALDEPVTSKIDTESSIAMSSCPDCDCKMGSCATAVLPTATTAFPALFSTVPNYYAGSAEPSLISSLYRPPISR
ncbi:MAG: hypothetical protein WCY88_09650 [Spongiibacteraceae bacterium]